MKLYFLIIIILNILILYNFNFFSKTFKLFDLPDGNRKIHHEPIANIGGLIIFVNLIFYFIFVNLYPSISENFSSELFVFCFIFLMIGIIDDKKNLNANLKLILFLIFILILLNFSNNLIITNLKFTFNNGEMSLHKFSVLFTIICFLAFINAVNMFDGINLQCGLYFLFLSIIFLTKNFSIYLYLTLIIGFITFIYLNKKDRCFLGNNGTYFISFLFSYSFIHSYNSQNSFFVDEIFIIMILPGLEMIRLTVSRILNKKHPFKADKNHLHHYLLSRYNLKISIIISFIMFTTPYLFYFIFSDYSLLIIFITIIFYSLLVNHIKQNST